MLVSTRPPALPDFAASRVAALLGGARVDVCIVGGSLAGMLAAYLLAREKRSTMVVDAGPIGVAQGVECAHLSSVIEQPYFALEADHGEVGARLAAQSFHAALDALEGIVRRERIACELERLDGYRFCAGNDASGIAEREVQAARRAGASGVEVAGSAPIEGADSGSCVRYPGQIQFHPGKLLEGLARAIGRLGGRVHWGVAVRGIESGRPSAVVTTAGHTIDAAHVVSSVAPRARPAHVIGLRLPRGAATRALYWSTEPGLRCARLRLGGPAGDILLVAGDGAPESLEAWARNHFPRAGEVVQRFQGELPAASDVFALTGLEPASSQSLHVSTASWGSAVTRAMVAGMAIRDFVVGARQPDESAP
ncbi:MAG TPA: FAD-dependent oxidoreductase [Usitatibacter sp.]|nr:FAD-dependent oxidoreductase [Usitatibacter sp.]